MATMKGVNETEKEAVKDVVARRLAPADVIDVSVRKDVDHDGDPILRIRVIFESEGNRLDPDKVLGLPRLLEESEPLQDLLEEHFPILTFMTPEEHREIEGAAA